MSLAMRSILVVGGGGGIGAPVSRFLATRGARVAVADIDLGRARAVFDEIGAAGGQAFALSGDVSKPEDAEAIVATTVSRYGRIDGLVNLSSYSRVGRLFDVPVEEFDRIVAVNLRGAFLVCTAAARRMAAQPRGGAIVQFSSVTSLFGSPGQGVYAMTKAGLASLVKSMALEWVKSGVRVNGLSPTTTDTPFAKEWLDAEPGRRAAIAQTNPFGRMGVPEDVFGMLELLLTDAARFVVGQTIFVDGGLSVVHPTIKG